MRTQDVSVAFEATDGFRIHLNIYADGVACVVHERADGVVFHGDPIPIPDALEQVADELRHLDLEEA